jgi:predicted kinase
MLVETPAPRATLILVCGLPGSGKTTHALKLETELRAIRLCPDEWMDALSLDLWDEGIRERIERLQGQLVQRLLAAGVTVIIEWGTWARSERDVLRLKARELGAAVELHCLSAPVDVLFERLQKRDREKPPITRTQLSEWANAFRAPSSEEQVLYDRFVILEAAQNDV